MQSFMVAQAATSLLLALALLLYVAAIRPRTASHWALTGALGTIVAWDAGAVVAWSHPEHAAGVRVAAQLSFLGACFAPTLLLYLALRTARVAVAEERPRATAVALLAAPALLFASVLTNDAHGLFASRLGFEMFTDPPASWGGPLFWVEVVWSYAAIAFGVGLCAWAALRSGDPRERKRLALLAAGALVPLASNVVRIGELVPLQFSITYAALAVTGLLLVAAIGRYQFLDFPIPARDVIAHLHDGLVLAHPSGRVLDANAAAGRFLGEAPEALRGRDVAELLRRLDPDSDPSALLAAADPVAHRRVVTRAGATLDLGLGWIGRGGGGRAGRFLVVADRTAQRRLDQEQWRAQRLESLGILAAGITHEVSNPLTFLRANLAHASKTLAQADQRPSSDGFIDELVELRALLGESLEGVERIAAIVEATRRLAQPPRASGEAVDVDRAVRDAIRLAALYRPDGVAVEHHRGSAVPGVLMPDGELAQVVLNLLLNAKQCLSGGSAGSILVETARAATAGAGDWAEIRVEDSGPGIPEEVRERVFDPFFTTRAPSEGMGLGLSISHRIVHAHGGTIEVGRASSLGGACFVVRLPAAPEPPLA